jgi:vacuolar iron transporter family protein
VSKHEASVEPSEFSGRTTASSSMAAGEYVSVSSQADTERADFVRERGELAADPEFERAELTGIYVHRGLEPALARQVAEQLMAHDVLAVHARDEPGISETLGARPVQAAMASAAAFAAGAALPLLTVVLAPERLLLPPVIDTSLVFLVLLGGPAARAGGSPVAAGAVRVAFWGALAMALTAAVGRSFGATV